MLELRFRFLSEVFPAAEQGDAVHPLSPSSFGGKEPVGSFHAPPGGGHAGLALPEPGHCG